MSKAEGENAGAHFFSRHGANTTIEQQFTRAKTGLTPDGVAGNPQTASRFYTNQLQIKAVNRATAIFKQTGNPVFDFDMGELVGEGFKKGGGDYIVTSNVQAVFKNGKLHTLFPLLSTLR